MCAVEQPVASSQPVAKGLRRKGLMNKVGHHQARKCFSLSDFCREIRPYMPARSTQVSSSHNVSNLSKIPVEKRNNYYFNSSLLIIV